MKRSKLALLPLGLTLLLAACASDPLPIPQHSFGVYATASTPSAAFRTLADPQGKAMLVALKPSLTQADVLRAEVLYDQNGRPGVEVTFTEPAARRLAALTGEARGRTLAVLVDGRLRLAPRVREPIRNGKVYLDGLASVYEARELADQLNALGSSRGAKRPAGGEAQSVWALKVSQLAGEPLSKPVLNQRMRCAEEPWVKESGTTMPRPWRCRRSSPMALAAFRASSMSPGSSQFSRCCARLAQTPAKQSACSSWRTDRPLAPPCARRAGGLR